MTDKVSIMDKYGPIYHFPKVDADHPINIPFIGINHCLPTYRNERISAQLTVLAYVLAGQGNVRVDNSSYQPKQGDVFILRSGSYHEVTADPAQAEPWTYIWYNIEGSWALKVLEAYRLLSTVVVSDATVGHHFKQGIEWAETKTIEDMSSELQIIFMQIVVQLSQIMRKRQELLSLPVQKIKVYIDNQVLKPFYMEQLAAELGCSSKQLNRNFKKEMGTTIYSYLLDKKIESAKMMLMETSLTIDQIADRLGYSDAHYFSNLFQTKTGVRPSVFRKTFQRI
ncbi:AraC family transcriptional regulator [Paenibacillus spongiae]|uniref:AraC family transcriptional regulator n=1 Tax=Paenibacillus spongiae TaxID=2909671 RepID=A0ABY5SL52_9BACL|nr:AraC family transcriptional regulator [Paenibacillus spongiae]UVI33240.1 AraC family transcriptional regulator [Paenibacillus spongiae]